MAGLSLDELDHRPKARSAALPNYAYGAMTWTKYYFAGTSRIASRACTGTTCSAPVYYLTDHLGSTSIITDSGGEKIAEMRYTAWGEVRYTWGSTPTDYTYTGQYSNVPEFGLMFYNARWYDPYITHFSQPDSIVPDPYNPQDLNRYSYARNNPIKYTDPSGHAVIGDTNEAGCSGQGPKCIIDMYARAGDYEGGDDSLRHYVRRHPDYNPFEDEDLADEEKAQVAIVMFQADAEDVAQIENFWDRVKESIETLIYNVAPVALTAIIVNGGDRDGDGSPDGSPYRYQGKPQIKKLTDYEVDLLQSKGYDVHDYKWGKSASKYDLYKDADGNIFVFRKGGKGQGEPLDININDFYGK